jgi:hypothetical protein
VAEGVIKPDEVIEKVELAAPPVKKIVAEEITDVVAQNKGKFEKEMSDKEANRLLRKLLYKKLCKPKKKSKFRVREPSSSDQSSSESE